MASQYGEVVRWKMHHARRLMKKRGRKGEPGGVTTTSETGWTYHVQVLHLAEEGRDPVHEFLLVRVHVAAAWVWSACVTAHDDVSDLVGFLLLSFGRLSVMRLERGVRGEFPVI